MSLSIVKKGSYYLIIGFLPLVANFLVLPFFTVYLSPQEYGILAIATVIQSYLTVLIDFGFGGAFSIFYYDYYKKKKLVDSLLFTILCTIVFLSCIIGILLLFFGKFIFQFLIKDATIVSFEKYGFIIFGLTFTLTIHTIIQNFYRNEENIKMFSLIALSGFFLMTFGTIFGVITFHLGAFGFLWGKLIGILLVLIPYFVYFFVKFKLKFRYKLVKPLFKYALPLMPYIAMGVLMNNIDKQYLEQFLGIKSLGIYNVALMIGSIPAVFLNSVQSTINPQIFRILKDDRTNLKDVKKLMTLLLIFILIINASLISFIGIITKLFIGKEYQEIVYYVPIIVLAYCFRAFYVILILPIEFEKKSKYLPVITFSGLMTALLFGPLLILTFKIYGVCLMIVFIQISQVVVSLFFSNKIKWLFTGIYRQTLFYFGTFILIILTLISLYLNKTFGFIWSNFLPIIGISIFILTNFGKELLKLKEKL